MLDEKLDFRGFVTGESQVAPCEDWQLVQLYHQHPELKVRELAQKTGRSIGEVYRTLRRTGGYPNRQVSDHDTVKLYATTGLGEKDIASHTNYSRRHVRRILRGK